MPANRPFGHLFRVRAVVVVWYYQIFKRHFGIEETKKDRKKFKKIERERERERHTFDDIDDSILGQQRQQTRTVPRFFHFYLFLFIFFASAFHTPSHPLPSNFFVCLRRLLSKCMRVHSPDGVLNTGGINRKGGKEYKEGKRTGERWAADGSSWWPTHRNSPPKDHPHIT